MQVGLHNLEIIPSPLPEDLDKTTLSPFEYVLQTASQKTLHVYSTELAASESAVPPGRDPSLVIGADTVIVTQSGAILEKPRSQADHVNMLRTLRDAPGGWHRVYTAVAVLAPLEEPVHPGYKLESSVEETKVFFARHASDELLEAYVRTREGVDKAGGYAVQGTGAVLIERIEGSYDCVVGLPLRATVGLIEKALTQDGEDEDGSESGSGEDEEA